MDDVVLHTRRPDVAKARLEALGIVIPIGTTARVMRRPREIKLNIEDRDHSWKPPQERCLNRQPIECHATQDTHINELISHRVQNQIFTTNTLQTAHIGMLSAVWLRLAPLHTAPEKARYRVVMLIVCLLYTSPSPRDATLSRMPSSA